MKRVEWSAGFKNWRRLLLAVYSSLFAILAFALASAYLNRSSGPVAYPFVLLFVACIALLLFSASLIVFLVYLPLSRIRKLAGDFDPKSGDLNGILETIRRMSPLAYEMANVIDLFRNSMEREYSASMLHKQSELLALQSQINPHFLYNTLDSIRGQVIGEGLAETGEMVETLSILFRYNIGRGDRLISLERELENIDNYMKIMRYRFADRFRLVKRIPEDSAILGREIPKLTLQPIVENAIMHGLEPKRTMGTITIRANATGSRILISVEDDGVGMDRATLDTLNASLTSPPADSLSKNGSGNSGIALVNVNERIRLIFGDEYGIHANSVKGLGTEINISLPLRGAGGT